MVTQDWIHKLLLRRCLRAVGPNPELRQKKAFIRALWLVAAAFMLANPLPQVVVATGLFTAFLSFSILDETS